MGVIPQLTTRDDSNGAAQTTPTQMKLLIALVILLAVGLLCTGLLLLLRSRRRAKNKAMTPNLEFEPEYKLARSSSKVSHRRLAANTAPINFTASKEMLVSHEPTSPSSPVPEIRITFPEEDDNGRKRMSDRVVVVRISDQGGVGLEPYNDSHLPPYQKSNEKMESLDLERLGGLKERSA